jgi:mono/diheme cytochrome c family protein
VEQEGIAQMVRFALAAAALLNTGVVAAQAIDEYAGVETFQRYCASCHGTGGTGDGPVAAAIPIPVPDLTRLEARDGAGFDEDVLRKIIDGRQPVIYHGTRYMPVWGYEFWIEEGADAKAEESVDVIVRNLVDYIRSIQADPGSG